MALILIPALVVAGFLATWSAQSERAQLEQSAQNQTRETVAAIDREIIATWNVLLILAASPDLNDGNLEAFYAQAKIASQRIGFLIALFDRRLGRQVINTEFPLGASFDVRTPSQRTEIDDELGRLKAPLVSNVFFGPRVKQYLVAVVVPVMRDGAVVYSLSAGVPIGRFSEILDSFVFAPNQTVSVIDRADTVVARSVKHSEFAGTQIVNFIPAEPESVMVAKNREGILFRWFNRRSAVTGWSVSVGVPDDVFRGPAHRAWTTFSIAGTLLFAAALALSYRWGGRLSQSVGALGIDRKPTREEFEILFDSAPNGVVVIGADGVIMLVNARLERKFGYDKGELIGRSIEILVPPRLRSKHIEFRKMFASNATPRPMGVGRDLFGLRKDGSEFPVEIALNPISTGAGDLVLATVVDISARKLSERRLSAVLTERDDFRRRLMQSQEQERLRLAHELHDQTGQTLTAAMLELRRFESLVQEEAGRERLSRLRKQMEEIGRTLHRVAWELRPASIDELGLASAIENYLSEWSAQYGIEADFFCGDSKIDELPDEIRTAIYRIVQEGLTNVAKHAQKASEVSVVIERGEPGLRLTIEDNGCGFESALTHGSNGRGEPGLGIAGMRERLALIGGELEIESPLGGGTTIFARIPLQSEGAQT